MSSWTYSWPLLYVCYMYVMLGNGKFWFELHCYHVDIRLLIIQHNMSGRFWGKALFSTTKGDKTTSQWSKWCQRIIVPLICRCLVNKSGLKFLSQVLGVTFLNVSKWPLWGPFPPHFQKWHFWCPTQKSCYDKISYFLCARTWVTGLWKAVNGKRLRLGQLEAYPWKLRGMSVQTSYVWGRWHKNWAHTSPQPFFFVRTWKLAKIVT